MTWYSAGLIVAHTEAYWSCAFCYCAGCESSCPSGLQVKGHRSPNRGTSAVALGLGGIASVSPFSSTRIPRWVHASLSSASKALNLCMPCVPCVPCVPAKPVAGSDWGPDGDASCCACESQIGPSVTLRLQLPEQLKWASVGLLLANPASLFIRPCGPSCGQSACDHRPAWIDLCCEDFVRRAPNFPRASKGR